MNLEEISEVIIDSEGDFKFVQLRYKEKTILYGNSKGILHRKLYHSFLNEFIKEDQVKEVIPIGGGRINIDKYKKVIETYGYSDIYGRFNDSVVKDILTRFIEENMKGFSLKIS